MVAGGQVVDTLQDWWGLNRAATSSDAIFPLVFSEKPQKPNGFRSKCWVLRRGFRARIVLVLYRSGVSSLHVAPCVAEIFAARPLLVTEHSGPVVSRSGANAASVTEFAGQEPSARPSRVLASKRPPLRGRLLAQRLAATIALLAQNQGN
jgi:hypothetical protein